MQLLFLLPGARAPTVLFQGPKIDIALRFADVSVVWKPRGKWRGGILTISLHLNLPKEPSRGGPPGARHSLLSIYPQELYSLR